VSIQALAAPLRLSWAFALTPGLLACAPPAPSDAVLFDDASVIDGSGAAARTTDVRIRGDRIVDVGDLEPTSADSVIEAAGLALAPGFIDTHSHHDRGLLETPGALAAVSQGVTTVVVGQDGGSPLPLGDFFLDLEASPAAVNVAAYAGHNSIRSLVMGEDFRREATAEEVAAMRAVLAEELEAGALGLSTGLEYDPGIYSSTDEVIRLARDAAAVGGRYISHMRSEDRAFFEALDELIEIGRATGMPVQVSHMKLAMRSLWGRADEALARLDAARAEGIDVTADVYPYEFWQSTMTVLFPGRSYTREAASFALAELAPPDGMLIARFEPEPAYVGRTLADIAESLGEDPVTVYLELIERAQAMEGDESIIARSMTPDDIGALLAWPHTNVSSDGSLAGRHPRGFGAFTRVFREHVRGRGDLELEEAVYKMTGLAADHMGISDRGAIRVGAFADLVLFDPITVGDRATPEEPTATSEGVLGVWVNGQHVYGHDGVGDRRPGRVIRRGGG
jgi:N-acyl-D-amino-acid deacylase